MFWHLPLSPVNLFGDEDISSPKLLLIIVDIFAARPQTITQSSGISESFIVRQHLTHCLESALQLEDQGL